MPKDGEGGDKQWEEPRPQDASEETERNRVRAGTPSPRRGNTPQASPPRLVSVEELMETAKGVTNMALAHEIIVNQGFQVRPGELPEGSLERQVKDVLHQAFWDGLEAQLQEDPPSYEHVLKLLEEIKETLLSFLLPGRSRLSSHIEEVLDLDLIRQQAQNGALDIGGLSRFIVDMMGSLCAPCRDQDVQKLKELADIVTLLKSIFSVLDLMKVDMANFALSSIRPHLMQQSVEYERNKFQDFLEKQPNALDYTEKWLEDTVRHLRGGAEGGAAAAPSSSLTPLQVHNQAYLLLLRWDHASVPFPETVLMDQVRFQEMQQEVQRLVLVSSVLLLVSSSVEEELSGRPGLMEELKNAVGVLLEDSHTPGFSLQEALLSIGDRVCEDLRCQASSGWAEPKAEALRGRISACSFPDNTVRQLMDSRVQNFLLGSLETTTRAPPPLPGGLSPVGRELQEVAVRFSRLVNFNKLVFSPFYQKILQKVLRPQEGPPSDT
ncbi:unnamed protein product [Ophioblennius macclurei]